MCVNISIYDNIYLTYTIYFYQCSWTQTNPDSHPRKFLNYMNFKNKFQSWILYNVYFRSEKIPLDKHGHHVSQRTMVSFRKNERCTNIFIE